MKEFVNITFLGASGVVTGSKFYIETSEKNILIDCGMFQGLKELRELNWNNLPINVEDIDIVLLTHGHLDHVGYLPRLVMQGFCGAIIGTAPTLEIAEIILMDSAKIHEEEAEKAEYLAIFSRHNLDMLALKKPGLMTNRFNNGSEKVMEGMEDDTEKLYELTVPSTND